MQCTAELATRARHRMRTYSRYISTHTDTHIHRPDRFYHYIAIYIYILCINIYTYTYKYSCVHLSTLSSARPYLHPWPRASECLHVCARARASAVPPRTAGRAAIEARPSASATPAVARRRAGSGAYGGQRRDRRGVPRADVRVERRRRVERLRAEPPAVNRRREGARMCRRGCVRARSHTRTRARTDTARGRVCAAGWHRRSVRRCS